MTSFSFNPVSRLLTNSQSASPTPQFIPTPSRINTVSQLAQGVIAAPSKPSESTLDTEKVLDMLLFRKSSKPKALVTPAALAPTPTPAVAALAPVVSAATQVLPTATAAAPTPKPKDPTPAVTTPVVTAPSPVKDPVRPVISSLKTAETSDEKNLNYYSKLKDFSIILSRSLVSLDKNLKKLSLNCLNS